MLLIVSGASGVGKSTLCAKLREEFGDELVLSVSATTRAPRVGEVDGVHYEFLTREAFEQKVSEGAFAEWAEVHGNLYGSPKRTIDRELEAGRSLLFDIDCQGAEQLRAAYPRETVSVMVLPPTWEVLAARLRGRGTDHEDVIAHRLENARDEIAATEAFDHVVVNETLEEAADRLRAIYLAGRSRTHRVWPSVSGRFDWVSGKK